VVLFGINAPNFSIHVIVFFLPYWVLSAVVFYDCMLAALLFYCGSINITATVILRLIFLLSTTVIGFSSTLVISLGDFYHGYSTYLYIAVGFSAWTIYLSWMWSYLERSLSEAETRGYTTPLRLEMTGLGWEPAPASALQRMENIWLSTRSSYA
jgi:hypothetical protein